MKLLVTGSDGQLGHDVLAAAAARGVQALGADIRELDITDSRAADAFIGQNRPDAVIHCAAYTAVERAQEEPERCEAVNVLGSENIARASAAAGAKMIYISTDYVFDGEARVPYDTGDEPAPLNVYGRTKLFGERAAAQLCPRSFIVRTSWVFGLHGNNFVKTILRLAAQRDEIDVVCDQTGSPTYTADLAGLLVDMAMTDKYGLYHATNEGLCSWADFAQEILRLAGRETVVNRVPSSGYASKAPRPMYSALSKRSLDAGGFSRLPPWQDALVRLMERLKDSETV